MNRWPEYLLDRMDRVLQSWTELERNWFEAYLEAVESIPVQSITVLTLPLPSTSLEERMEGMFETRSHLGRLALVKERGARAEAALYKVLARLMTYQTGRLEDVEMNDRYTHHVPTERSARYDRIRGEGIH